MLEALGELSAEELEGVGEIDVERGVWLPLETVELAGDEADEAAAQIEALEEPDDVVGCYSTWRGGG